MVCHGRPEHLPPRQYFRFQIHLRQQHRRSDAGLLSNVFLIRRFCFAFVASVLKKLLVWIVIVFTRIYFESYCKMPTRSNKSILYSFYHKIHLHGILHLQRHSKLKPADLTKRRS